MEAITTAVTSAGTMIFGLIGDVVDLIVAQPLLLLPIGVTFIGMGVGFAKSLIRV